MGMHRDVIQVYWSGETTSGFTFRCSVRQAALTGIDGSR
jgi:hypothetical protein